MYIVFQKLRFFKRISFDGLLGKHMFSTNHFCRNTFYMFYYLSKSIDILRFPVHYISIPYSYSCDLLVVAFTIILLFFDVISYFFKKPFHKFSWNSHIFWWRDWFLWKTITWSQKHFAAFLLCPKCNANQIILFVLF